MFTFLSASSPHQPDVLAGDDIASNTQYFISLYFLFRSHSTTNWHWLQHNNVFPSFFHGNPTKIFPHIPRNPHLRKRLQARKQRDSCLLAAGQNLSWWDFSPYFKMFMCLFYDFSLNSSCETLSSAVRNAEHLPTVCTVVPLSTLIQKHMSVKLLDVASLPGAQFQGELHVNRTLLRAYTLRALNTDYNGFSIAWFYLTTKEKINCVQKHTDSKYIYIYMVSQEERT
jgi:hypothetical protein